MLVKTSELKDNTLCYVVCMLQKPHLVWGKTIGLHEHSDQIIVPELGSILCYSPFIGRGAASVIIERENIATFRDHEAFVIKGKKGPPVGNHQADWRPVEWGDRPKKMWSAVNGRYFLYGNSGNAPMGDNYMEGETPVIAGLRCYVKSKLGDEVEIPDELL
jgi:hypothetical protein